MELPALTTGGQHGVIAQEWRLRQAGAKEGAPSSKKSLFLNSVGIGGTLFQKLLILVNHLYLGQLGYFGHVLEGMGPQGL